jgi:hypothetical protein
LFVNDLITALAGAGTARHADGVTGDARRRVVTTRVAAILLTVLALPVIVVLPPATAACAGPQLELHQRGASVPPRTVGKGATEKVVYTVRRGDSLEVLGTHLTFDCNDTVSFTQMGCGPRIADPVEPERPFRDARIVLTQSGRTWMLAALGNVGADLRAQIEVDLPREVRAGPAVLAVQEGGEPVGGGLDLVIG